MEGKEGQLSDASQQSSVSLSKRLRSQNLSGRAKQGSGIMLNYTVFGDGHNKVTDKVPSSLAVRGRCQGWLRSRWVVYSVKPLKLLK